MQPKRDAVVSSPTALEVVPDAPTVPAWAAEGLGSSEKAVQSPQEGNTSGLGVSLEERMTGGSSTPLPPGAAPPNLDEEPERIVTPRG